MSGAKLSAQKRSGDVLVMFGIMLAILIKFGDACANIFDQLEMDISEKDRFGPVLTRRDAGAGGGREEEMGNCPYNFDKIQHLSYGVICIKMSRKSLPPPPPKKNENAPTHIPLRVRLSILSSKSGTRGRPDQAPVPRQ